MAMKTSDWEVINIEADVSYRAISNIKISQTALYLSGSVLSFSTRLEICAKVQEWRASRVQSNIALSSNMAHSRKFRPHQIRELGSYAVEQWNADLSNPHRRTRKGETGNRKMMRSDEIESENKLEKAFEFDLDFEKIYPSLSSFLFLSLLFFSFLSRSKKMVSYFIIISACETIACGIQCMLTFQWIMQFT